MPILSAEPDLFPSDLLADVGAADSWWVVYTLARREKELMRRLRSLGIGHYGPLLRKRNRSAAGRVRESFVPLFPSYVFLRGDDAARQQALATKCVSRTLPVPDSAGLVRDLQQVCRLLASDAPLEPEARIEPGRRVRVRSGSMLGLQGTVVKRRGKDWLVVVVEFLQQGVSVLLEDFQVEPI
ncbi:MAG TPA: transcription termination/antitermination NusG family protein [Pirellulales bacterium]|jgi:transcription antitermination factor NusG|nr:transcription termination/antitermination NusG family protein [Pirellulales bacterium]